MRFVVDPWRAESVDDQVQRLHTNSRSFLGGRPHLASSEVTQKWRMTQLVRVFCFFPLGVEVVMSIPNDNSELGGSGSWL